MEKPDRGKATKLLHQIIDTIAYIVKSDNVTLFELYPLINNPLTQPIPKVFKSHLFGLFLELGLLYQYAGTTSLRCKNVDHWGKILSSKPYTSIITIIRIQSVRLKKCNYQYHQQTQMKCQQQRCLPEMIIFISNDFGKSFTIVFIS